MVAYSFKGRFVAPIEARTKTQTIRAVGKKRHARKGDILQVYTGDRFHPRKVGIARCILAAPITLDFRAGLVTWDHQREAGDVPIPIKGQAALDAFAVSDGFESWDDLQTFWLQTHDTSIAFTGVRIFWGDTFASLTPAGASKDD